MVFPGVSKVITSHDSVFLFTITALSASYFHSSAPRTSRPTWHRGSASPIISSAHDWGRQASTGAVTSVAMHAVLALCSSL